VRSGRLSILVLAIGAGSVLGGCSMSSSPALVELKDATVYVGARTTSVAPGGLIGAGIGGVRPSRGGVLIDLVVESGPSPNRLERAIPVLTGPERDLKEARVEVRRAVAALNGSADISRLIRIAGESGEVALHAPRIDDEDVNASAIAVFPLGGGRYPKDSTFEARGRWFLVQPIAVGTGRALEPGIYTVELTPEFVARLFPAAGKAHALSARVVIGVGRPADEASISLDGF